MGRTPSLFMEGEKRPRQDNYRIENIDKKVTIILLISFQLAYNKADKDPYNLIRITCLQVFLFFSHERM